jgi:hypothetical protein
VHGCVCKLLCWNNSSGGGDGSILGHLNLKKRAYSSHTKIVTQRIVMQYVVFARLCMLLCWIDRIFKLVCKLCTLLPAAMSSMPFKEQAIAADTNSNHLTICDLLALIAAFEADAQQRTLRQGPFARSCLNRLYPDPSLLVKRVLCLVQVQQLGLEQCYPATMTTKLTNQ